MFGAQSGRKFVTSRRQRGQRHHQDKRERPGACALDEPFATEHVPFFRQARRQVVERHFRLDIAQPVSIRKAIEDVKCRVPTQNPTCE